MNTKATSYTIKELEALSGFDRRTIAYYVHEGLLPSVGRRGRGTVYPAAFKEGLMFIRAVRDLQDAGSLRAVTLAEIKEIMGKLAPHELRDLQTGPDESIRALFQEPDWDTRKLAVPVEAVVKNNKQKNNTQKSAPLKATYRDLPKTQSSKELTSLSVGQLIELIETTVATAADNGASHEQLVRLSMSMQLSEHISVSVTGLAREHSPLLEQLVSKLHEVE